VRIEGRFSQGSVPVPLTITATEREEVLYEYGGGRPFRRVTTPETQFIEEAGKAEFPSMSPGFSQLDVTGVFMLAKSSNAASAKRAGSAALRGAPGEKLSVDRGRMEVHFDSLINDTFDLYTNAEGLLTGISRTFNAGPITMSIAHEFFDFRPVDGVMLPFRIERVVRGRKSGIIDVDRSILDAPASPQLFAPPRMDVPARSSPIRRPPEAREER
jgi:hypothetical protein